VIDLDFEFEGELWEWVSTTSWFFVTLPVDISDDIKAFTKHLARGFRSVRVDVAIGNTQWKTSVFPSKEKGAFLLPIKAAVRKAENIQTGDLIQVKLSVPL